MPEGWVLPPLGFGRDDLKRWPGSSLAGARAPIARSGKASGWKHHLPRSELQPARDTVRESPEFPKDLRHVTEERELPIWSNATAETPPRELARIK